MHAHTLIEQPGLSEIDAQYITASLLISSPFVTPQHSNDDVLTILGAQPDLLALPVTEHDVPIGLINRNIFLSGMTKQYRRELYGRKSCIAFMDKEPLIVKQSLSIQSLSLQVVEKGGKTLHDGFIITDENGKYLGLGTGESLVRIISQLQAEKNRLVMESINYASVIQKSFLRASHDALNSAAIAEHFLHWEPRDQVGGDYYFCRKFDDGFFFALIDCTGHGVPGAFMTLIMASFLDQILGTHSPQDPATVMHLLNQKVKIALSQTGHGHHSSQPSSDVHDTSALEQSDDGMDAAFCWFDTTAGKVVYAGAKIALYYIDPNNPQVHIVDPERCGIGYIDTSMDYQWHNKQLDLPAGSAVYLTTDGIIDQIGGPKHIAFGKKRFMSLLLTQHEHPMSAQKNLLLQGFYAYQGHQRRRDDISLAGFRI